MRDIKFRAWDKLNDHMLGPYDLTDSIFNNKAIRSLPLMQFTGLLDKNGKEIYEGDILKSWYSRDLSMKDIVYTQEVVEYEIKQYSGEAGFEILFPERAEIIGNIYQNPELLESVQK